MSLYQAFETDEDRVAKGVWHQMGEARFKCAYYGFVNPLYKLAQKRVWEEHRFRSSHGMIPEKEREALNMLVFIQGVLLEWEGVTDREGKVLPFTEENAIKLFTELPLLYVTLENVSGDIKHYRPADLDTDAKN